MSLSTYYTLINNSSITGSTSINAPSGYRGYYSGVTGVGNNPCFTITGNGTVTNNTILLGGGGLGGGGTTYNNINKFTGSNGHYGSHAIIISSGITTTIINYGAMSGGGGGAGNSLQYNMTGNYANFNFNTNSNAGTIGFLAGGNGGAGGGGGSSGMNDQPFTPVKTPNQNGNYGYSSYSNNSGGGGYIYNSGITKPLYGGFGSTGYYGSVQSNPYVNGGNGGGNGGSVGINIYSFAQSGGGGAGFWGLGGQGVSYVPTSVANITGGAGSGSSNPFYSKGASAPSVTLHYGSSTVTNSYYGGNGGAGGFSILNNGSLSSLSNLQGMTSTNYLGPLSLKGNCPTSYNILISGNNSYGQLFLYPTPSQQTISNLTLQYTTGSTIPATSTTYYNVISYYNFSQVLIPITSGNIIKTVSGVNYYYGSWALTSQQSLSIQNNTATMYYYNLTITPVIPTGFISEVYGGKDLANIFVLYSS